MYGGIQESFRSKSEGKPSQSKAAASRRTPKPRPPMNVDWDDIIQMQGACLRNGINKVGIPDLMIAQHAIQNDLELYSKDKHFALLARCVPLVLC